MYYVPLCDELSSAPSDMAPTATHCVECEQLGREDYVHLRLCLSCGHVGCCDSSPYRHATAHFQSTGHPVVRSFEPGEDWRWCFVHYQVG